MKHILFVIILVVNHNTNSDSKLQWNQTNFRKLPNNLTLIPGVKCATNQRLSDTGKCNNYKETNYKRTTKVLSNLLLKTSPPFDLSHIKGVSFRCRQQSQKYVEDLQNLKLWALKMYDSTAKLPSGILNGNINQLGDFDICLLAHSTKNKISGQYCLASVQIKSNFSNGYLASLQSAIQSHLHFRSDLSDPGHRVPKFSSIYWALCVPSACSPHDVEIGISSYINQAFASTEISIDVQVESNMCQTNRDWYFSQSTLIAVTIFAAITLIVLCAGLYDCCATSEPNPWITAFSIKRNIISLVKVSGSQDQIEAIHAVRFVNAILLLVSHKSLAVFFYSYTNRTAMVEQLSRPWTVLSRAASLYTDPFIMISGTLTAYSLLAKLEKHRKINLFEEYASRLLRIVPSFAALIAFCTFILPSMGSGPMWNAVVTYHSDVCRQYWWRNLLFVHNYFGFKNICLTHTHHVGIDIQLFFVSPFFVFLLWKWPRKGVYFLSLLALISTILRYYVTYTMRLSNYIHFGTSIKQLFATADNMYVLPVHRATIYIMGILLGYSLRNYKNFPLSRKQIKIGNAVAVFTIIAGFGGPAFMGSINYVYNPTDAAWYAAFAPILWCFSFAWLIYIVHLGHDVPFRRIIGWPPLSLWTKISYSIYLTQFPVFFYNIGVRRAPVEFNLIPIFVPLYEFLWVLISAIILTLLFEMPFQNIRNLIFSKKAKTDKITRSKIS